MPKDKKQGILLSLIISLIMIYVMAALNIDVRQGAFSGEAWIVALQRLPLGLLVGIICDLLVCTPLSRRIVEKVTTKKDSEKYKIFILRFCMVIFMTICMTVFACIASGKFGMDGVIDFFTYLPYNFTIALPIQMLIVAPLSMKIVEQVAPVEAKA